MSTSSNNQQPAPAANTADPPVLDNYAKAIKQMKDGARNSTEGLNEEFERLASASIDEKRQAIPVLQKLCESLGLLNGIIRVMELKLGGWKIGFERDVRDHDASQAAQEQ